MAGQSDRSSRVGRRGVVSSLGLALAGSLAPAASKATSLARTVRAGDGTTYLLAAVTPDVLRITRKTGGQSSTVGEDGALVDRGWPSPLTTSGGRASTRCGAFIINFADSGRTLAVNKGKRRVQQLAFEPGGDVRFDLGKGPLLGLGQGGPQFDRRGTIDRMKSGQGGYRLATHGARVPIPWLIGSGDNWALFFHSPTGSFDLTGEHGTFRPDTANEAIDLFVVAASDPAAVMRAYATITGLPEMPPLWSLGYQQSHRTLGTPDEILAEARRFRAAKMPCDAMIYLGTGFCDNGWNTDNGEFTWNSRAFPDPAGAIDALHRDGFKVVLHVVIEGHHLRGRVTDPCTVTPRLPSGRLPDGSWPPDREVPCYWPYHKSLVDLGVDGWWPDQGDGFDASSRLARNRMYFEGQQLWRPNRRVYALHRNGFAGMQRYATFLWSGDIQSRWETLATHVSVAVNAALSGIFYWGTDIGGFVATEELTGELYARWFQFGAFNTLFRSHGRDWRMHTPFGWTDGDRGVPETAAWHPDPASLKDPRVEPICRKYLDLRYRLTPYLYSAVHAACTSGMPIVRTLWLHYPDDPAAVARGDQYLYGPDLLVAPVVERGATMRRLYLPKGRWYDFWTGAAVEGGREITRTVDLETLPLYVRAGAILPLGARRQHLADGDTAPEELVVHPGADGRFLLYEDDGDTFDYRLGRFRLTEFLWDDAARRLLVAPLAGHDGHAPAARAYSIRVAGTDGLKTLHHDGRGTASLTI